MDNPPVAQVIETYRDRLYAAAFSVSKNAQDAEDAVQETFIQYWSQGKTYASETHLRAWLLRVAINRAKNKSSAFFRRNAVLLDDYSETLEFPSPEASTLFATVMALPVKYRIVIHLFYYEDYSVKEIAGILQTTPGSVKVRLSRGRAMLRQTLKEAWDDDE